MKTVKSLQCGTPYFFLFLFSICISNEKVNSTTVAARQDCCGGGRLKARQIPSAEYTLPPSVRMRGAAPPRGREQDTHIIPALFGHISAAFGQVRYCPSHMMDFRQINQKNVTARPKTKKCC